MLLPSGAGSRPPEDEEELDAEIEDALREAILVLLCLLYTQAHSRMDNMEQELDLLRNAPTPDRRPEEDVPREQRRTADENMWRVDAPQPIDHGKGSLLDSSGKVRFTLR
jgi:immunoglobulin-binding protein 1